MTDIPFRAGKGSVRPLVSMPPPPAHHRLQSRNTAIPGSADRPGSYGISQDGFLGTDNVCGALGVWEVDGCRSGHIRRGGDAGGDPAAGGPGTSPSTAGSAAAGIARTRLAPTAVEIHRSSSHDDGIGDAGMRTPAAH